MSILDGGGYSSSNASLTIPSPFMSSEQQLQIRGNIPLSTAITTVISSSGTPTSMVQNFTPSLHQANLLEEGLSVMTTQQPTTSINNQRLVERKE